MSTYNIRLGSQLSFDTEQEGDIIKAVEQLNSEHKMGKFLSNLIRLALENPEVLSMKDGKYVKGEMIKQLDKLGMTYNRKEYITSVNKELLKMKKKIDAIYDISMKTYTLAQMGKQLGLEEKSDNQLQATFVLERQLKQLQDNLGVILSDQVYASNKLDETHKKADDTLEYIIETYDNILNEIKQNIQSQSGKEIVRVVEMVPDTKEATSSDIREIAQSIDRVEDNTKEKESNMGVTTGTNDTNMNTANINMAELINQADNTDKDKNNNRPEIGEIGGSDDEIIDFGSADMDLLSNFFNL